MASEFAGIYSKNGKGRVFEDRGAYAPPDIKILRRICQKCGVSVAILWPDGQIRGEAALYFLFVYIVLSVSLFEL